MSTSPPSISPPVPEKDGLFLDDGSRVAVIGGGPAGSLFTYFLFEMAERIGMELAVDIYEPKDFTKTAPHGCNMCGGIISESLVQLLDTRSTGRAWKRLFPGSVAEPFFGRNRIHTSSSPPSHDPGAR